MRTIPRTSRFIRGLPGISENSSARPLDTGLVKAPYTGFVLDQDTGGAIRAPGRCDVYMGVGTRPAKWRPGVLRRGKLITCL